MDGFQWIGIALAALALIGIGYQAFAFVRLGRFFASPLPFAGGETGVTILKPLHGSEPRLSENLASFLAQDHDGPLQMVCGVADPGDPACEVVQVLQRCHPEADIALVVDPVGHGANAKIGNLINMMAAAKHDVVVLSDSDMSVPPTYLAALLAALDEPGVGAVTCFYRGRADTGLWSRLSAGIVSHVALPDMVVGHTTGLARPCMGSTIALTRKTLDAIGGFERFADVLADDHAIGAAVAALGLRVTIPPMILTHACTEQSLAQVWRQKLRWAATIRGLQPWGYAGSIVTRPLPLALLAAPLVPGLGVPLALAALVTRAAVSRRVDRIAGARSASLWWLPLIDLVDFVVFAASFTVRKVDWRGKRLTIEDEGRIAA